MEVVAAVGGALLSASVQPLIERLISGELNIFARREKIHADIKDWVTMLAEINHLLDDAEDKQSDNAVKIWLDEFRDLTYDIEDVLDEFNTEALKRKVMEDSQAITNKQRKFIPTRFTSFAFKNKIKSRIKEITKRFQHINKLQAQTLNLRRIVNGTGSNQQLKARPMTTSLVEESDICGRNDDKKAILPMLLGNEEGGNNSFPVIAIWGMGGIGKTTLAQLVYNDSAVKEFFNIRAWVCVSDNFDVTILTRTILRQVDPKISDLKDLDLNSLQETLKEKLSQKKFLLVLDDVWEEDYTKWILLRRPFVSASSSSKIVVTARKKNVAPIKGDDYAYPVKELPDDDCLSILARHALAAQSFDAHSDLKEIGQELAKRCDGLPLAATLLGGLLRNKPRLEDWQRVLTNATETRKSIDQILKLSYNDLPSHLKRCFVYCAIVPKDYEFDRDELVSLWMAEGFLDHAQGGTLMEDLGIEYFEELVSRSFFQLSNSNQSMSIYLQKIYFHPTNSRRSVFVMHDLISDLAQTIAKDVCYNYDNKSEGDMSGSKYEKVRHASFSLIKDLQEYEVYSPMKNLRTIVGFPILRKYVMYGEGRQENCYEFSPQSRCLRVLSLTVCGLPKSIGEFKHLRHLNLSFSTIEQLPESVSSLLNLHTLLLRCCYRLMKLPDRTRNLVNLRHLDIGSTHHLLKLPSGIDMLTNLQTLSKFIVKKGDGAAITELNNLNKLRGSLSIEGLQNVQDAKVANLKGKQGLEELVLLWGFSHHRHGRNDMLVLESLEPNQNLKRLTIQDYRGAEFPSWVSTMSQLVSLNLNSCETTEFLPPLGKLRSLRELRILGLKAVKTIGVEFYGNVPEPFPSLERLEIFVMSEWREWSGGNMGGEGFPKLQELKLYHCPKLKSFPHMGLPRSQKSLFVISCHALERFPIIYTSNGEQSLLEELDIIDCASLQYFETNFMLPPSLRKLRIKGCGNLLSLPDGLMMPDDNENQPQSHLQYLAIEGCQRLDSLPTGKFPAALKTLEICRCSLKLESAISEKNAALERIIIWGNNSIKAFPSIDCLQSLKNLDLSYCHALESFPEALPGSITSLLIEDCDNLRQPIAEWSLGMLPSLETLEVGRCPATADVESFPDDNCCWLPTSLKQLRIRDFINLESVSMGLQKLTSLRALIITNCPKLRFLPREALPTSLEDLYIDGCPLLKEHYSTGEMGSLRISYVD